MECVIMVTKEHVSQSNRADHGALWLRQERSEPETRYIHCRLGHGSCVT